MFERLCARCGRIIAVWSESEMELAFERHTLDRCPITMRGPEVTESIIFSFDDLLFLKNCGITVNDDKQ